MTDPNDTTTSDLLALLAGPVKRHQAPEPVAPEPLPAQEEQSSSEAPPGCNNDSDMHDMHMWHVARIEDPEERRRAALMEAPQAPRPREVFQGHVLITNN
jgi:hypothetical protein